MVRVASRQARGRALIHETSGPAFANAAAAPSLKPLRPASGGQECYRVFRDELRHEAGGQAVRPQPAKILIEVAELR